MDTSKNKKTFIYHLSNTIIMKSHNLFVLIVFQLLLVASIPAEECELIEKCKATLNSGVFSMEVEDINSDDVYEILVGTGSSINQKIGTLYLFEYKECEAYWAPKNQHTSPNAAITSIKIEDMNLDSRKEILGSSLSGYSAIFVLKPDFSELMKVYDLNLVGIKTLDSKDIDNDGLPEILAASKSVVYLIDISPGSFNRLEYKVEWSKDLGSEVSFVAIDDLNFDTKKEFVIVENDNSKEKAEIHVIDAEKKELLYEGDIAGGIYLPSESNIKIFDIDHDQRKEIIIGTRTRGIMVFDLEEGGNSLNPELETPVTALNILNISGKESIVFGSFPFVYAFDPDGNDGKYMWKTKVNSSIYVIEAYRKGDFSGVVVGTATHLLLLDAKTGKKLCEWFIPKGKLAKEINIRKLKVKDLDSDGLPEIVAGTNYVETRLETRYSFGEIRVFELKFPEMYKASSTTTTSPIEEETSTSTTIEEEITKRPIPTSTIPPSTLAPKEEELLDSNMILIVAGIIIFGMMLLVLTLVVAFIFWKREKNV